MEKESAPYQEREKPVDLVYTDWKWMKYSDYYWEETYSPRPQNRNNEDIDAFGPFLVRTPESIIGFTHPLHTESTSREDSPVIFSFAHSQKTKEAYLEFACKHGHLGSRVPLFSSIDSKNAIWGESFLFWRRQQWLLKNALRLWDWIKFNDVKNLARVINWVERDNYKIVKYQLGSPKEIDIFTSGRNHWSGYQYIIGSSYLMPFWDDEKKEHHILHGEMYIGYQKDCIPGDLKIPAIRLLQEIINTQTAEFRTSIVLYWDEQRNCYTQRLIPSSLLAAMWYQLSQYVSGERQIKQCIICHQWVDVTNVKGKESWTKHRECANWDRVTKLRKLPIVKVMQKQGKSVEQIATDINVEPRHIERWLENEIRKEHK